MQVSKIKSRPELLAMAMKLSDRETRINMIHGACETGAISGDFQVAFSRADFLVSDFDHLTTDFIIEVSHSHVYVSFETPRKNIDAL